MRIVKVKWGKRAEFEAIPGFVYCGRQFGGFPASPLANQFRRVTAGSGAATILREYRDWLLVTLNCGAKTPVSEAMAALTADSVLGCWCVDKEEAGEAFPASRAWGVGDHMTESVEFWVNGVPMPGGSKRARTTKSGKIAIFDDCKGNKGWRQVVSYAARKRMGTIGHLPKLPPFEGPLRLEVTFFMPRPKAHYRNGTLRSDAPQFHLQKPDCTKLLRSTEDAMTDAGVWLDDAQVVQQIATKRWAAAEGPGAKIKVSTIE